MKPRGANRIIFTFKTAVLKRIFLKAEFLKTSRFPIFVEQSKNPMKKTLLAIAALTLLTQSSLVAQKTGSPFQFLRFNESARAAALGGAFVAMPEDPSAVFFNPASVWTSGDKAISATFLKHVLDINSGLLSYSDHAENFGSYAASVSYTNYGSFQRADRNGPTAGTFGVNDVSLAVSYANELDTNFFKGQLSYGLTGKFLFVGLEVLNSTALALDGGLLLQLPHIRTNIGLAVLHLGTQLSTFNGEKEPLPLDVRIGVNHRLRGLPLLLNFSFHHLADETDDVFQRFENFSLGGEFYFGKSIQARIGYDNGVRRSTTESSSRKLAGLSAGVGIITNFANIDYAISSFGSPATLHRVSVGFGL
ncbi:MAG TPA: PorV/PorQ family protein [Patescibacteria group bacterium]|nr:PorV/PorQ family protein [Patescibacteria group bacterium]